MDQTKVIVTFMVFTVAFALVGTNAKGGAKPGTDVKIILGGTVAAILLSLIAETGQAPADFAKGLAGVALLASVLTNGTPVFNAIDKNVSTPAVTGTTTPSPQSQKVAST
jgi:hypothetical protein